MTAREPHPPGYHQRTVPRDGDHLAGYGDCRCWCPRCLSPTPGAKCICPDCNRQCGFDHRAQADEIEAQYPRAEEATDAAR